MPPPFLFFDDNGDTSASDAIAPFIPAGSKSKKKKLTFRQMLILIEAQKRLQEGGHHSFGSVLKGFGKGALGGVGWTFDKIMRPSWAVTAGTEAAIESGGNPAKIAHGVVRGLKGHERIGFGEILHEHTGLGKRWSGLLGFPLDVVTDPLMQASIAAAPETGGGSLALYAALRASGKAVAKETLRKAADEAGRRVLAGGTDDILGQVLKEGGEKYQHRLAAWKLNKDRNVFEGPLKPVKLEGEPGLKSGSLETQMEENMTIAMAKGEQKVYDKQYAHLRLGTGKYSKDFLPQVLRVPVIYKPGDKIAERGIPVISQLFDIKGRYLSPGYGERVLHEGKMVRKHAAEYNHKVMVDYMQKRLQPFGRMSDQKKLGALDLFENPLKKARGGRWAAVVKAGNDSPYLYDLNKRYVTHLLKSGKIDEEDLNFVKAVHSVTEEMFKHDQAVGVRVSHFAEEHPGKLYVPHVFNDTENALFLKGLKTDAAYVRRRKNDSSLGELVHDMESGKMPKNLTVVKDIEQALVHRSRAGAEQQADQALLNTIKSAVGIPMRIVDKKKAARAAARYEAAKEAEAAAVRAAAHAESDHASAITEASGRAIDYFNRAHKAIDKQIKEARAAYKEKHIARLEKSKAVSNRKLAAALGGAQKVAKLDEGKNAAGKYVELLPKRQQAKVKGLTAAQKKEYVRTYFHDKWKAEHEIVSAGRPQHEIDAIDNEIKKIQQGRFSTPAIEALKVQKASLDADLDKTLKQLHNKKTVLSRQVLSESQGALSAANAAQAQARKELKAAEKALDLAYKGKKNKAFDSRIHQEITSDRVMDEFGNSFAFPKDYAARIERYERLLSGAPGEVARFTSALAKFMGAWKVFVTVVDPGYRIRNTMTDFWNMWLAGVPGRAMLRYGTKAAKIMAAARKGDARALNIIRQVSEHGIFAGLYAGDIQKAAKFVRGGAVKEGEAPLMNVPVLHAMQIFNRSAENWGRLTHYMYRTEGLGEDVATAAMKVKEAHFDYEELTDFEQKLKLFFPFYTWTRKNIPYQVKKLFSTPGRYAAFPKFVQEMQFAAGNPDQPVSDFVEAGFGVPLPFGKDLYYMPQFGVSDLQAINSREGAVQRIESLLGPHVKIPIEMMTGKQLYTGQEVASPNHPRSPISDWGAALLGHIPGNPANVGQTSRLGPGGKWVSGPGASPWASYFLGQVPLSRAAFVTGPGSIASKSAGAGMPPSWWSALGGQSIVKNDPELLSIFENMDINETVDKYISGLRDEGLLPRRRRKKSKLDQLMERAWMSQYGGG